MRRRPLLGVRVSFNGRCATRRPSRLALLLALAFPALVPEMGWAQAPPAATASSAPQVPDPIVVTVNVVGVTPIPGVELKPIQLPAPVQLADAAQIASSHAVDLSDFLNQR